MSNYSGESGHRASADRIIERVQAKLETAGKNVDLAGDQRSLNWDNKRHRRRTRDKFRQNASGDIVNEAILPGFGETGHGENARDDCGNPHPFLCDSCGHQVDFGRTCGQSVCARCAIAWNRDYAIKKAAKIRRFRKEKHHHTPKAEHQKIHHQIVSPSLGWYYDLAAAGYTIEEAQEITRKVVKDILNEMRAQGVLVRHSYRGEKEDGSIRSEEDDRGWWKEVVYSGREFYGDVRGALAWKPHYHCIVVADWLEVKGDGDSPGLSERVEEATGWVIHRIEDDDGISIPDDGTMARVLTYCLSHADIMISEDGHNRSAVWEVGSFEGDPIRSSSRFSAKPSDLDWADSVVREKAAPKVLGLRSGTTECGATIPAVDDPDELARRVIETLYPDDDRRDDVPEDVVLYHVSEGNIGVEISSTSGGGGSVTVTDAFGDPVGSDGWGGGNLPDVPSEPVVEAVDEPVTPLADSGDGHGDHGDDCGCGHGNQDVDDDPECDGQLIPLGEARRRGLLEDEEWCREAAHVDEAREADREWPDDLEPWKTSSPGKAIGAG